MNKSRKFYSPGMVTALLLMLPVSAYGLWYVISERLIASRLYWLWAFLWLFVPVLVIQRVIVTSNGMNYGEFMNNARKAMFRRN